jgi:primosomal protein N' (replication factor Y)
MTGTDALTHIVSVVVESALPHLDREFDYLVPSSLSGQVVVGTRVRVPFAGRLVNGVVTAEPHDSPAGVKLASLKSAAAVPSFTADAISLARDVARRYGGSLWDVLRLMAPPRVAAVEKRSPAARSDPESASRLTSARTRLADAVPTEALRAVWCALPTLDRVTVPADALLAHALQHVSGTQAHGSGIVVVPDARALDACASVAEGAGLKPWTHASGGDFVVLDHDAGPIARYESYLAAMNGHARLILGTRAAALQPVPKLASIAVWDEGSDALLDAHAPYFHARTVAAMRAQDGDIALLLAAFAPSVDAAALVEHGFAQAEFASRDDARAAAPLVNVMGEDARAREGGSGRHWMPSAAWKGLAEEAGDRPVAVLVPRAGYVSAIACARCQAWALCPACGGELMLASAVAVPTCRDCGAAHPDLHCGECRSPTFAAVRQGVEAIAAQLRRMAPAVEVFLSSAATGTLADDSVSRGIVVATPGALPAVQRGYSRLVVIGADRPTPGGLGAELLATRWWINAAALVKRGADGGVVTLVGDVLPGIRRAVQTWDPWGAAVDAYAERKQLGLPPVRRAVRLEGSQRALDAARSALAGVRDADFGLDAESAIVLVSRGRAQEVVDALRSLVTERSKAGESPLRMRVDPALP